MTGGGADLESLRAEVSRLRAEVARLRAGPPIPTSTTPIRYAMFRAARLLDLHPTTMQRLCARGVFTVIRPGGKGRGKRAFLFSDEVEAYATGGEEAVRTLRVRRRRLGSRYQSGE